jgi:hypothetical protein
MDSRSEEVIRQQEQMQSNRGVWEEHWREIAERVLPRENWFQASDKTPGEKRTEKVFDSTAGLALRAFCCGNGVNADTTHDEMAQADRTRPVLG